MNTIELRSERRRMSNEEARKRFLESPAGRQATVKHQLAVSNPHKRVNASVRALAATMAPQKHLNVKR